MTAFVKQEFETLNITIDSSAVKALHMLVLQFEIRGDHPLVLNSLALGTRRVVWRPQDRKAVFDIFKVSENDVTKAIARVPKNIINPEWHVVGDALNLLSIWIMHIAHNSTTLSKEEKESVMFNICKVVNYRFFTSLCNNTFFKYLANEQVMLAAVNDLSKKFSIVTYGTWRNALEARARDIISPESIHYSTIELMDNDKGVIYILSDMRTHIASRIKNIYAVYKETLESRNIIADYSTTKEVDGKKLIRDQVSLLDSMVSNITQEVMNYNAFYDKYLCTVISEMFGTLGNGDLLKTALSMFSATAIRQSQTDGALDEIRKVDGKTRYVGIRILIANLIQKMYHRMTIDRVELTKANIIINTKNVFSSSRIADDDLLIIKDSFEYFIDEIKTTKRDATKASLRIAMILYIICKTLKYI